MEHIRWDVRHTQGPLRACMGRSPVPSGNGRNALIGIHLTEDLLEKREIELE
jgi:hypothetical protein